MLVEDSPTIREMFIYTLASEKDIEIVAIAKDGEEAIELARKVHPDIILMDIEMPKLNGFDAAEEIMRENPCPILLMSAVWNIDEIKETSIKRNIGALGVYEKPYGPGHPDFKELYNKIVTDIRLMSDVHVIKRHNKKNTPIKDEPCAQTRVKRSIVLIGASTGGPPILQLILSALPADYPLPVLVAQHMSSDFVNSLIEWLDDLCSIKIKKAEDGEKIHGGYAYIAPAEYHLCLNGDRIKLLKADKEDLTVPSISKLFSSINPFYAQKIVAILLSGMGSDGADSIVKLKNNGALTLAQNEATSIVFGMANEAKKLGGIELTLPPEEIIGLLLEMQDK